MERIKRGITKIRQEHATLKKELKEKTIGYILAAFSLVAGLAWNEAIKALISQFFPAPGNDLAVKFLYAVIVTAVVVVISVYLIRLVEEKEKN